MSSKFLRGLVLAGVATASIATAAAPAAAVTPASAPAANKAAVQVAAPAQAPTTAKADVQSFRRGGWCGGYYHHRYRGCRYPTWLPYGWAGDYYYGGGPYYAYAQPGFVSTTTYVAWNGYSYYF